MEEKKLSEHISLFEFVKNGMLQSEKTWENFSNLINIYKKNKNLVIKASNYRVIINETEFEIKNKVQTRESLYPFKIILLAAYDENNLIGIGDVIPWRLSGDMLKFKETTLGNFILMGRKTFETFKRPLPGRTSIIITTNKDYTFPEDNGFDYSSCFIFHSIEEAFEWFGKLEIPKLYVIGGGEIYQQTIDIADELDLTRVLAKVEVFDENPKFFPKVDIDIWKISSNQPKFKNDKNQFDYNFTTYVRKNNFSDIRINYSLIKKLIVNYFTPKIK